jgi:hypothetical protein
MVQHHRVVGRHPPDFSARARETTPEAGALPDSTSIFG